MYMDVDFDTFEVIYEDAVLEEFDITTLEVFLNSVLEDEEKK